MNPETLKTKSNHIHLSYDEFKKNKPKWTSYFRRGIEYLLFRFGLFLGKKFSLSKLQCFGRRLGKIAYLFLNKDRGIIESQLKLILWRMSGYKKSPFQEKINGTQQLPAIQIQAGRKI